MSREGKPQATGEQHIHEAVTSTYPAIMDTGTPTTYQEIMQSYDDYLIGTQQQPSEVNYFEGHGLSYTKMLLGVEMSAEAEHYNNSLQGPVTDENKLYMITGRYFDGNADTEEEEESCVQLQDNSVETEHITELPASHRKFRPGVANAHNGQIWEPFKRGSSSPSWDTSFLLGSWLSLSPPLSTLKKLSLSLSPPMILASF